MNSNVEDVMRKTKSYWYEDGLVETLAGLFFVAVGALLLVEWAAPPDAAYRGIFAPGLMVICALWILGGRRIINWLKERITYPRTGYVEYRRQKARTKAPRIIMAAVVGAAVSLAIVSSMFYRQDIVRAIPLLIGAGVAMLLVRIGGELGLQRFYVEAAWSLVIGALLAALTDNMSLGMALYYGLLGAAVLVAGVVTLLRYLRAAPAEGDHDD
jgi:hypothetical protein